MKCDAFIQFVQPSNTLFGFIESYVIESTFITDITSISKKNHFFRVNRPNSKQFSFLHILNAKKNIKKKDLFIFVLKKNSSKKNYKRPNYKTKNICNIGKTYVIF